MVSHRVKDHFDAFPSNELKSWHKIAVAGHDDNRAHHVPQRQAREIQANSHIDALLADVESEIGIG
ncbi:hypothetical protein MTBLM5_40184 [Magnetospirillum sp. LM-5]|nr:hypothetical protein MTBLM5_40184 [Magnetospirillum sp. LM-5]